MLEVREIKKSFNPGTPNEVRALQGVNFTLENGSFVIIIGTNGSGKSTMLNAVGGTFYVDSGVISLGGANITNWPEYKRAKPVSYTHLRAHETPEHLVCRLLLEK